MYLNTLYLNTLKNHSNTVFKCMQIKIFINTLIIKILRFLSDLKRSSSEGNVFIHFFTDRKKVNT